MTSGLTLRRVYPRVCGGTILLLYIRRLYQGLSPRVRGNLMANIAIAIIAWSIPACAGEPRPKVCAVYRRKVYPRVCGGTYREHPRSGPGAGLSPRVRGNPG